jgi:sulfate permease, SulP family
MGEEAINLISMRDFTPKLITVFREGYGLRDFKSDAIAGLTVAIVALPLSMAIAIASGASPERGLTTAIVGGFIISALGGSRFQIGGPAAAFVALLAAIATRHGYDGLLIATFLAGWIMMAAGALRLGDYIKYVPHPVIIGFTAGIAVLIVASQLRELLGLTLPGPEPAAFLPKLGILAQSLGAINPETAAIAIACIAVISYLRRWRPKWPGFLIAAALAAIAVAGLGLEVETVASRFGAIPAMLPAPGLPEFTWERVAALLPDAFAIAMLGSIESLLSATVADSLSGFRHRPNCELVAQGLANIATSLFGGITATGTIARTATNVSAGARGPVSGMLHSLYLLLTMLVAAPLAAHIPLAALAAILLAVAWNMVERADIKALLRASRGDAAVLIVTLGLTVFRDLVEGIAAGVVLGSLLFMHRMSETTGVESVHHDDGNGETETGVTGAVIHRISGAFFFGATGTISSVLDRLNVTPKAHVFDLSDVTFVDATAAQLLKDFIRRAKFKGTSVHIAGASEEVGHHLSRYGLTADAAPQHTSVEACLALLRAGQ